MSDEAVSKKRKLNGLSNKHSSHQNSKRSSELQRLRELESLFRKDEGQLNVLSDLIDIAQRGSGEAKALGAAIRASHRVLVTLLHAGRLRARKDHHSDPSHSQVADWLRGQQRRFQDTCVQLLEREGEGENIDLQVLALETSLLWLRDVSHYSQKAKGEGQDIPSVFLKNVLSALILSDTVAIETKTLWIEQYMNKYDDMRLYFLREVNRLLAAMTEQLVGGSRFPDSTRKDIVETVLRLLEELENMSTTKTGVARFWTLLIEDDDDENHNDDFLTSTDDETDAPKKGNAKPRARAARSNIKNLANHRETFSNAWLRLLSQDLSIGQIRRVLSILHAKILPHLSNPLLLSDFLSDAVNRGGTTAVLALNGLFTLMMHHKLDFPEFYTRLYGLITPALLHTPFRSRFFRLLELFLRSSHLPVGLVASFAKRLSRRALFAPPGAIVFIVPFVYNLLKRHPQCMQLVHRETVGIDQVSDTFDDKERDPAKSGALHSSLWELNALAQTSSTQIAHGVSNPSNGHYLHTVSALARIINEQFTKPEYDLEDFFDHSTASMFDAEISRLDKIWSGDRSRGKEVSSALALNISLSIFNAEDSAIRHWRTTGQHVN